MTPRIVSASITAKIPTRTAKPRPIPNDEWGDGVKGGRLVRQVMDSQGALKGVSKTHSGLRRQRPEWLGTQGEFWARC